jgi:hypothetical protein
LKRVGRDKRGGDYPQGQVSSQPQGNSTGRGEPGLRGDGASLGTIESNEVGVTG